MRGVPAWVMLLSLLAVAPTQAQADGEVAVLAVDDPVGDVDGPAGAAASFADLVSAKVELTSESAGVSFTVASLETSLASPLGWELWMAFDYRGTRFDAVIETSPNSVVASQVGSDVLSIFRVDAGTMEPVVRYLPAHSDAAAKVFNATFPLTWLADRSGYVPAPGEPLKVLGARSFWSGIGIATPHNPNPLGPLPAATDSADFPDGTFLTIPGAIGDLGLATPLAVRYSNGDATTYHWPIEVVNRGERHLDVTFEMPTGGPEARFPAGLHLAPGEERTVPVYVTVPFRHEHGVSERFPLTASTLEGDRATLQLGIDYPAIPQPAGHHPNLFLHGHDTTFGGGRAWMNTAEEDERSAPGARFTPDFGHCPSPNDALAGGWIWSFGLDPALRIGLDGRVGEAGTLELTIDGPVAEGNAYARLVRVNPTDLRASDKLSTPNDPYRGEAKVAAGPGPTDLRFALPIPPELDFVAPGGPANLYLQVILCPEPSEAGYVAARPATLVSGIRSVNAITFGHAVLPLDEYHDPIVVTGIGDDLRLSVPDPVRRAAAGATVVWHTNLEVNQDMHGTLAVRLFGNAAPNARLLGEATIPAANATIPLALVVPDHGAGTTLDLLLEVTDQADPSRTAAIALSVIVDPTAVTDDSELASNFGVKAKESPSLTLVLVLTVLAAAVAFRRRQP